MSERETVTTDDSRRPLLEARSLSRSFGSGATAVRALRDVDLCVAEGEMVAIMGPSGSGKSTLLHILGALDRPDGGSVAIDGRRYDDLDDRELTKLRGEVFGFVFQFFNLLPTLSAAENVLVPALVNGERPGQYGERVDLLMEKVGLGERAAHLPTELSGGEQQRVAIARALLRHPRLVLADEPTGNLDSSAGATVMGLLREVVDEGQTVVMVTHDPGAAALADRVVFLRDGAFVGEVPGGDTGAVIDAFREVEAGGGELQRALT
ncbi:MAG TPA: ABC transporter ATP-binding protein [Solirubrobacterales bacterium]|jgi:putative ABC transport system ATP-binding protein|nr:ABC transporter ATP-binding protein [Solirubrobacterales bacterium]